MIDSHVHSAYSKHSSGSIEQVIISAIDKGISILTITDHAPFFLDSTNRLRKDEICDYKENILSLKEKYFNKIKVLLGLECDYFENCFDYNQEIIDFIKPDYIIGSIHYIPGVNRNINVWDLDKINNPQVFCSYFDQVKALIKSNQFDSIGHPDILLRVINSDVLQKYHCEIMDLLTESKLAYELNTSGLRKSKYNPTTNLEYFGEWSYPCLSNIQYGVENKIDFVIGSDAHTPEDVGLGIEDILLTTHKIGLEKICYFENRIKKHVEISSLLRD